MHLCLVIRNEKNKELAFCLSSMPLIHLYRLPFDKMHTFADCVEDRKAVNSRFLVIILLNSEKRKNRYRQSLQPNDF